MLLPQVAWLFLVAMFFLWIGGFMVFNEGKEHVLTASRKLVGVSRIFLAGNEERDRFNLRGLELRRNLNVAVDVVLIQWSAGAALLILRNVAVEIPSVSPTGNDDVRAAVSQVRAEPDNHAYIFHRSPSL